MSPQIKAEKCRVPGCSNPAGKSRDVCYACYEAAARLVRSGEATWEMLEELQLVSGVKSQSCNPLRSAFYAKRKKVETHPSMSKPPRSRMAV